MERRNEREEEALVSPTPTPHLFNEPAYHAQLSPPPLNPVLASFHVVSGLGEIPSEIVFRPLHIKSPL